MEYTKLSVTPLAARQLRRVTLELGELEGRKVSQGYALELLTGDWLAKLHCATATPAPAEPPPDASTRPEDWAADGASMRYVGPPGGRSE